MRTNIVDYYRKRANEYERVYAKPERQRDLLHLRKTVGDVFAGHHVLELACGTGYWTEVLARTAASVLACDIAAEVLEIARRKDWGAGQVDFRSADSYAPPDFGRRYSAGFAGFWWSHVPKRRIEPFLASFHGRLESGAPVVFIDNRYVSGSSTPISRRDEHGDSFQRRQLRDGDVFEVLKNFPTEEELLQSVAAVASSAKVILTDYFWLLSYRTR